MNQLNEYKTFVRERCGRVRLGDIMRGPFGCEYRKFNSLMRQEGWTVGVKLNKSSPGENEYTFVEPEANGQRVFA